MPSSIDTAINAWNTPLLLPSDTTAATNTTFDWHKTLQQMPSIDTIEIKVTECQHTVGDVYDLLEKIHDDGIGYHDSVVSYAIPLIIALLAFSFGFLFDAVNHINEKYDSPEIVKIFEDHWSRRWFFHATKICVCIASLYVLATLFTYGVEFGPYVMVIINIFIVIVATAYALITVRFAHSCMEFNKPAGVIAMLEAQRLKPTSGFKSFCKRKYQQFIHRKDKEWALMQKRGRKFYAPFIERQEQTNYVDNIISLSKYILKHQEQKTFTLVLNSVMKMSKKHNAEFNEFETKTIIPTPYPHVIVNDFMKGLQKVLAQYPQSRDFYNDLCRWYLGIFDKSKFVSYHDVKNLQQILLSAANNKDVAFLEKYIYRSTSAFNYLDTLKRKAFVMGAGKNDIEDVCETANKTWSDLRNNHYFAMAYASYIGLHELLPFLVRGVNTEGLYPSNRKEVMIRYASCRKITNGSSFFGDNTTEEFTDRRYDVAEILGQYTTLLLMLTNSRTSCVPVSHELQKEIYAAENDLKLYANAVKQNSAFVALYPQIAKADFNSILQDTFHAIADPKTYNPETEVLNVSAATHANNETLSFTEFLTKVLSKLFRGDGVPVPVTDNYKANVNLSVLSQFENIFCCNHKVIRTDLKELTRNPSDESADKLISIDRYSIRIPKIHFIYECYQGLMHRYYRDCMNVIEDRVYYAYLTALGNMQIRQETVRTFDVWNRISVLASKSSQDFVILSFRGYESCPDTCNVEIVMVEKSITLCEGLPMYEYFKDSLVLIRRNTLPILGGRVFPIAHSHEESDELKGIMDIVTTIDPGVEVKYNSKAQIVVFRLEPTTLV